jgi:hypothetical protein
MGRRRRARSILKASLRRVRVLLSRGRVRAVTTPDQLPHGIGQLGRGIIGRRAGRRGSLTYCKRRSRGELRSAALAIGREDGGDRQEKPLEMGIIGNWKGILRMRKSDILALCGRPCPPETAREARSSRDEHQISPQGNLCAQIGKKVQVASYQPTLRPTHHTTSLDQPGLVHGHLPHHIYPLQIAYCRGACPACLLRRIRSLRMFSSAPMS